MAFAELVKEMKSLIGNRDIQSAGKAKGGTEAESMLKKWVKVLDAGGLKSSALSSQLNSFIGRSVNRTSSAILAGRLSTLAIQSTQMGAALAQMPTKDYVWRMGKLLSGNLEFAEAFNSDFIQRRLREAPPAVRMARTPPMTTTALVRITRPKSGGSPARSPRQTTDVRSKTSPSTTRLNVL